MLGIDRKAPPQVEGEFAKKIREDLARARDGKVADAGKALNSDQLQYHAVWK